jgi:DNA-binding protein H-NS
MSNPVLKEQTATRANGLAAALPKPSPAPADAGAASSSGLPDLTALADDALAALVEQGQAEILCRKEKKESDFLALVAETARTLGVSPARLAAAVSNKNQRQRATGGSDGRSVVAPKYRDPADPSRAWSGRGEPPSWLTFGDETNPKTGKPLPLRKFWLSEQEK